MIFGRLFRGGAAAAVAVVMLAGCGGAETTEAVDAQQAAPPVTSTPSSTPVFVAPELNLDEIPSAPAYVPAPDIVTAAPPGTVDDGREGAGSDGLVAPDGVPAVFDASDLTTKPVPAGLGDDVPRPKKLIVQDLVSGTGEAIAVNDTAEVRYVGARYRDGVVFDSSWEADGPVPLPLRGMIPGFREGLVGMREGGRRLLVIPASGGFGAAGAADVPPDTDLVYVVDLVQVSG